jgi:hypothetical protein
MFPTFGVMCRATGKATGYTHTARTMAISGWAGFGFEFGLREVLGLRMLTRGKGGDAVGLIGTCHIANLTSYNLR